MTENALFQRFFEEVADDIDPIQVIVGGSVFEVKRVDKPLVLPGFEAQALVEAELRDGRRLIFPFASLQGFISGRSWE